MLARSLNALCMCIGVLVGFAMTGAAFAHRTTAPPDLAAFYALGGTTDDHCADAGAPVRLVTGACEACRLVAAACVPEDAPNVTPACLTSERSAAWSGGLAVPPSRPVLAPRPRAPPVLTA